MQRDTRGKLSLGSSQPVPLPPPFTYILPTYISVGAAAALLVNVPAPAQCVCGPCQPSTSCALPPLALEIFHRLRVPN